MHRSHLVSVALSLRGTRLARSARADQRARADSGPSLGRTPRAATRPSPITDHLSPITSPRSPFQLSVNPSLLSLTASAGCVI